MADVVWDQATFDNAYQRWNPQFGVYQASYRRQFYGSDTHVFVHRLQAIEAQLPGQITPSDNILFVGCGWGWTLEAAIDTFGHQRSWGTDTSAFIQDNLDATGSLGVAQARADIAPLIFDIDVTDPTAQQQFRDAGAGTTSGAPATRGRFDWLVTEHVMEGIDPANYATFLDGLDALQTGAGGVLHMVIAKEPGDNPFDPTLGLTSKTLAEWVAVRPAHYWLDLEQNRDIVGGGL